MTDPDLRDPNLDRAYRETRRDEPPPELDERIRAAARRAVGTRPQSLEQQAADERRRSWTSRWRLPLSVAATVVIAATVTVMVQEEDSRPRNDAGRSIEQMKAPAREAEQPAVSSSDAARTSVESAPAAPPAQSSAPAEPAERKLEKRTLEAQQPASADSAPSASGRMEMREQVPAPAASPPLAAPAPAPPLAATPAPIPAPPAAAPLPAPASRSAPTAAPQMAPAGAASDSLRRDRNLGDRPERASREASTSAIRSPEAWVEYIRSLRAQGRETEATAELAELRRAYPDFKLPTDLGGPGQ